LDSISQIALGAGVGELVLGRKIGNKAQALGAIAGTVPDLDVFLKYIVTLTPDEELLIHRSYSHAAFTHVFMALPFAWLTYVLFKRRIPFIRFYLLWFLGFLTHALLDCCTTYGTQFWLPFSRALVGLNNISVVDPMYTIPFLIILVICLFLPKAGKQRRVFAWLAIIFSTSYIGYATLNKFSADKVFKTALAEKNISYKQFTTSPTLFTSFLWNMVAVNDSMIYVSEYSVFQENKEVSIAGYKRNLELLEPFKNSKPVETLIWFSQGAYFVEQQSPDTLNFYTIKWGRSNFTKTRAEEAFVFYSKIYKDAAGKTAIVRVTPDFKNRDMRLFFTMIYNRVFE
jgi:inner membrane protein